MFIAAKRAKENNMNTTTYAGFWKRTVAFIIDNILAAIAPAVICLPLFMWQVAAASSAPESERALHIGAAVVIYVIWQLLGLVCMWLYFAFMESGSRQATLGKRLMKIKVVGKDGQRISFARATGRFFAKIVSYMIMYIGLIMAGLTNRKRALHDYIAETYVVNDSFQPSDPLPDTPSHPWWLGIIVVLMIVFLGGLMLLGVVASHTSGRAFQAAAQLQTLAEQPDLPYGAIPAGDITYYHYSDGYHASFEDNNGGEYSLYLPAAGEEICCEDYPGQSCEATGFAECD